MKLFLAIYLIFSVCSTAAAQTDATKNLYALFDGEWEWTLRENPTFASYLGDKRYNALWNDVSLEAINRRNQHRAETLARLKQINRQELSVKDRLNYDLFQKDLDEAAEAAKFKSYLLPIKHDSGIQTTDQLAEFLPFQTVKDYEDWLARLDAFPVYMEQTIELLREGQRRKLLWARVVMDDVVLLSGAVPLDILERNVDEWITATTGKTNK